jgi:pimeloyl-ACP methyl ester carboxylesterase
MVEHPDYESVRAPVLAIYAVYQTPAQLIPRYDTADAETRLAMKQIFEMWRPFAKAQRDALRTRLPGARVDEIEGASHYVFISHRDRVLRDIRDFLQK